MYYIGPKETKVLKALGNRLRAYRLHRNESQQIMSERLRMSRQKYARMESGDPRIPIGSWITVSCILNRLDDWRFIFLEEENLFLRAEIESKFNSRQRASKR
jgi:transcriptional regulator with XRE-family HTH domain